MALKTLADGNKRVVILAAKPVQVTLGDLRPRDAGLQHRVARPDGHRRSAGRGVLGDHDLFDYFLDFYARVRVPGRGREGHIQ